MSIVMPVRTDETIEVKRRYPVPIAQVARALSTRQVLEQWFAPDPGIVINFTEFDFRENGGFRIAYEMPDGSNPCVNARYTTIALPHELAFTWQWEAPDPHADLETFVHVRIVELAGETELVLTHHCLPSKDARARHFEAWNLTLSNLANQLNAGDGEEGAL